MFINDLFEDVMDDLDRRKMAEDATFTIIRHIYTHGFDAIDEDGKYFVSFPDDNGLTKEYGFENLLFLVGLKDKKAIGNHGSMVKFSKYIDGRYDYALKFSCLSTMDAKEAKNKLNSTEAIKVISHEMLHFIDSLRTSEKINSADYALSDKSNYYNDPSEFNAYYHDLTSNLHSFINFAMEHSSDKDFDIEEYADIYDYDDDFNSMLKKMITTDRFTSSFWKHLTPERRQALLKRVYRLHQEAKKLINSLKRNSMLSSEHG